jgi:hypothetical protein
MPLRLLDYSDRELLIRVHEVAQEHGGQAPSMEIANALGMSEKSRAQSVGARLGRPQMRGLIQRDPERSPAEWFLTELGIAMAFGSAKTSQMRAVENSKPEEMLLMLREMANHQRLAPEGAQHMFRREWHRATYLARVNGR